MVTADHVKPAPENDYTKQHKATTTSKPTDSKPPAKTSVPRTAAVGAHSTTMPKPSRIGVDTKKFARTVYDTDKGNDSSDRSAIQHNREPSLKLPALYRALHARAAIPSPANEKYQGLRTYPHIPLHLRNDIACSSSTKPRANNRSDNNADQNSKATGNKPFTQTRVGRQIHTPA